MIKYTVNVNTSKISTLLDPAEGKIIIEGNNDQIVIRKLNNNLFAALQGDKSTDVVLVRKDAETIVLLIGGQYYFVDAKSTLDQMTEEILAKSQSGLRQTQVRSPMPGLILKHNVSEGQSVKEGDHLVVLEAMKMENVIKSPIAGVVKKINKNVSESVEKGEILLLID